MPIILIQSLKKNGDPMALQRSLIEHMPSNIIMYVADLSAIRQIEVCIKLKKIIIIKNLYLHKFIFC